jgi:hypothetical protein
MQLDSLQRAALEQGQPVPVVIEQTECVVIRRDVYERTCGSISPEDTYAAVESVLDRDDDPGLESYQHYKI